MNGINGETEAWNGRTIDDLTNSFNEYTNGYTNGMKSIAEVCGKEIETVDSSIVVMIVGRSSRIRAFRSSTLVSVDRGFQQRHHANQNQSQ